MPRPFLRKEAPVPEETFVPEPAPTGLTTKPVPASYSRLAFRHMRLLAVAAVVASMVTSFIVVVGVALVLSHTSETRNALDRSFATRSKIQEIFSLLQDAETGQRGFAITGFRAFLEPYDGALPRIEQEVATLQRLLIDDPEQQALLAMFVELKDLRIATLQKGIDATVANGVAAGRKVILIGRGKALMDQIRSVIGEMILIEERRIALRTAQDNRSETVLRNVIFAVVGGVVLVVALAAWLVHLHFRRMLRSEELTQETLARQQAIFDGAMEAILILNESGSVETANPSAEKLFGYEPGAMRGVDFGSLADLSGQDDIGTGARLRQLLAPGSRQEVEGRARSGTTFPAELGLSELMVRGRRLYVAVLRDITERKRTEQMKNEFVSTVSHELRTPLTSISGSLGLVTAGAAGALPERAARLLNIAHSNSQRLIRLINDILDIEKMESGKIVFDLKSVSLKSLAEQAIDANRGFADGFNVLLRLEPSAIDQIVRVDSDRIIQVITNLLSNAIKFSPAGGEVTVDIQRHGRAVRLSVRDRGPGIPENFRSRIFSKFAQADASDTRAKGGTGLGLSIVWEIVTRLGGTIGFDSAPGGGTVFRMDLPADAAAPHDNVRHQVLICDPDAHTADQLCKLLDEHGIASKVAGDAAAAQALAREGCFDVALIGMVCGDNDCLGLVQALRRDAATCDMTVLVVAPEAWSETDGGLAAYDVLDWLQKPVSPAAVVETVRNALARAAATRPRVLHVDDDPDVLQIVAGTLSGQAEIVSVTSLSEARGALKQHRFDVAILDLSLGEDSGMDLLRDLHRDDGSPIPVIVFSAHDSNADIAARVNVMLTKSRASLDNLAAAVARVARKPIPQPAEMTQ
jgi:PAS domain S-box-containing protein